jgi:hypothetical protein
LIYRHPKNSHDKTKVNYVFISGDLFVIQKLPTPYDTRYTENSGDDEYSSDKKGNNDIYSQLRLGSPMDVIPKPTNLRPFLVAQKDNASLIRQIIAQLVSEALLFPQAFCYTKDSLAVHAT